MNYEDYIKVDPEIRHGRPCLWGTDIAVYDVLERVSRGMSYAEIQNEFPKLDEKSIEACLAFAKEHNPIWNN